MSKQQGFTLIELVVVIVILGILAATALPKFVDLRGDASTAAAQGVAAALSSASATNYSARLLNTTANTVSVANCTHVSALLVGGALPSGYSNTASGAASVTAGATLLCTVTGPNSSTANFTAFGT